LCVEASSDISHYPESHMTDNKKQLLAAAVLLAATSGANAATQFTATLTGAQETPPNNLTATGFATFTLNDAQTSLSFQATINGLDFNTLQTPSTTADDVTNAHIHAGAPPGIAASVVWGFIGTPFNDNNPPDTVVTPFTGGAVGGTVSGKWDLPEGNGTTLALQLPSILSGNSYINFHTVAFPSGAIRGQILAVPEPSTLAMISAGMLGLIGVARRRRMIGS